MRADLGVFLLDSAILARNVTNPMVTPEKELRPASGVSWSTRAGPSENVATGSDADLPTVVIVVPTLNSVSTLKQCLESIEESAYSRQKRKVIVVDGGSTDGTARLASSLGACVLSRPGTSRGAACNEGVHHEKGSIVAFTDADAIVTPEWLSKIVTEMKNDPTLDAIGGPDLGLEDTSRVARAASAIELFRRQNEARGWKAVFKIKGVNSAYRREPFLEVGGFDGDLFYGEESGISDSGPANETPKARLLRWSTTR